jgi:hypothetical protein
MPDAFLQGEIRDNRGHRLILEGLLATDAEAAQDQAFVRFVQTFC